MTRPGLERLEFKPHQGKAALVIECNETYIRFRKIKSDWAFEKYKECRKNSNRELGGPKGL